MALSERKLLTMWHRREEIRQQIADLAKDQKKLDTRIIGELERRDVSSIVIAGEKIKMTQQEEVVYDEAGLMRDMKRDPKMKPVLKRTTKRVFNRKALLQEIQAGHVPRRLIRKHSSLKQKAPYLQPGSRRKKKEDE